MDDIFIKETDCFGLINRDSISYDDSEFFGNSLILFDLYKINCYVKGTKGILGIKLTYKCRENNEEYSTINIKTNDTDIIDQEFIFEPQENITNIILWKKEKFQGFEITTNKKRIKRFGLDKDDKILLNEFSSGNNIALGFYLKFDKNNGVTAMGFYYIEKKKYKIFLYSYLLWLRVKLKNKKYLDYIEDNISKLDYESKAVYKTCLLSKNNFMGIMKYLIN